MKRQIIILHSHSAGRYFLVFHLCWLEFSVPDKFLALLGADAGLIELGRTYLRIILIFAPFFMCNYSVTAFARNDYATSTVMAGSLAGSAFNIVFDYIFIFPVGLGFSGAALATAFCPIVHYVGVLQTLSE